MKYAQAAMVPNFERNLSACRALIGLETTTNLKEIAPLNCHGIVIRLGLYKSRTQ
jgi:hypothetical protein